MGGLDVEREGEVGLEDDMVKDGWITGGARASIAMASWSTGKLRGEIKT